MGFFSKILNYADNENPNGFGRHAREGYLEKGKKAGYKVASNLSKISEGEKHFEKWKDESLSLPSVNDVIHPRLALEAAKEGFLFAFEEVMEERKSLMDDYSLSCNKCCGYALPVEGTERNYRCECGNRFSGAKHPC